MYDADNSHAVEVVVDPVDNAVCAAPGGVPVFERWSKLLADPMRIIEERSDDELVRREGDRFGKTLSELSPRGRRDEELVP